MSRGYGLPLRDAVIVGENELQAECGACGQVHVFDTEKRKPEVGRIIYVATVCKAKKAFRYDGLRALQPLRIVAGEPS